MIICDVDSSAHKYAEEYWKDYYGKPMEKDQINHFKEILHSIKCEYQV